MIIFNTLHVADVSTEYASVAKLQCTFVIISKKTAHDILAFYPHV